MQTFLPLPDFDESAIILDYRRLGNQRLEARQLLTSLLNGSGWSHHPAAKMWKGYELALAEYGNIMILEWIDRGYRNTMDLIDVDDYVLPPWFGDERVHSSHRSNLLRKDYNYYSQFGWSEGPDLPYHWPDPKEYSDG